MKPLITPVLSYYRTLNAAKAAIKEKKYACSKADVVINLSDDGKLQDVSNISSIWVLLSLSPMVDHDCLIGLYLSA